MDDFAAEFNEKMAAKSREVCERIEREDGGGRVALTDRERQILDMWPRFEDGAPVMIDDAVRGIIGPVRLIRLMHGSASLFGEDDSVLLCDGKRAQRPRVLDADGVEIKVGDIVWFIPACAFEPGESYEVTGINKYGEVMLEFHFERSTGVKGEYLTHIRPDSWGRLELDADSGPLHYCVSRGIDYERGSTRSMMEAFASDIIRRAKALAGVEEARDED